MDKNLNNKKILNFAKTSLIILSISFFLIFSLELLARKKFNSFSNGSCDREKIIGEITIFIPSKNCKIYVKHWEHDKVVVYETDAMSNRTSTLPINFKEDMSKIAFFGDSFTWGDMNNSKETYVHHTAANLKKIKKKNSGYHNYGVPGFNLIQVLERMKQADLNNYDYVIYGLTPNDLFSPQTLDLKKEKKRENLNKKSTLKLLQEKLKKHNLRIVKVASKLFFDFFPKYYINFYTLRDINLAGYLSKDSSEYWDKRYSELFIQLEKLDPDIKNKLIIQVVAQRVQVQLYASGDIESALAFDNRIEVMCNKLNIKCSFSQIDELSKLKNSHFTIDGHFNSEANLIIGKKLAKFISSI